LLISVFAAATRASVDACITRLSRDHPEQSVRERYAIVLQAIDHVDLVE